MTPLSDKLLAVPETKNIQCAVCKYLGERGHEHICENYGHIIFEMDVATLSKSGMLHEYEVKISRSDFLADKNKQKKYGLAKFDMYASPQGLEARLPNYFNYVCPVGLIKTEEIPYYAGLYYYDNGELVWVKSAKRIHKMPSDKVVITGKMLRLHTQRKYLGCAMLTFKNNKIKEQYKAIQIKRPG